MNGSVQTGDVLDLASKLTPSSLDSVITSPPYARQRDKQYGGVDESEYPAWTVRWMEAIRPALKPNGSVAVVIRSHVREGACSPYVLRTRLALNEAGWFEPDELIWIKPDAPPLGHVERPRRSWEHILWFSRSRKPFCNPFHERIFSRRLGLGVGVKGAGDYLHQTVAQHSDGTARCRDFCETRVGENEEGNPHPAPYPIKLAMWMVKLLTDEDGLVLDPFTGSGTTGVAALRCGRRFQGFELKPEYAQYAQDRIRKVSHPDDAFFRQFGLI